MKKLLLSILSLVAMAGFARAEVTLNVNDATDFKGTLIEETLKADGTPQEGKHYQPIESFTLGNFTFSFSTTSENESQIPAYYWATSTSKTQQQTIRIYNGSSMTIAAPEGTTITRIDMKGSNGGKNLAVTASTGAFVLDGNSGVWTGSANSLTLSVNATWRISQFTFYTDGDDTPEPPVAPVTPDPTPSEKSGYKYNLASSIESGKIYALFADGKAANALNATYNYGYLQTTAVEEEDGVFVADSINGFTFTAVDGGYTIQDVYGRYLYQTGTYDSFNVSTEAVEGSVWTVNVAADGTATITNVAMQKTVYYNPSYNTFSSLAEPAEGTVVPTIYLRGEKVEVTTPDTPVTPPAAEGVTFAATSEIVSGQQYILVIGEQYGAPISETSSYGRLSLTDATFADGKTTAPEAAAITITEVAGKGYTLVDSYGRYLAMDATHTTSFQLYTEENEGCYWTAEMVDGKVKFTNALNTTCIICQSGTYTNIAPAENPDTFQLPALYVKESTGSVSAVKFDATSGEAIYYNLQGIRVNADALTPGIYVRRQGNKSVKVMIR